jgi:hypothetical protein
MTDADHVPRATAAIDHGLRLGLGSHLVDQALSHFGPAAARARPRGGGSAEGRLILRRGAHRPLKTIV